MKQFVLGLLLGSAAVAMGQSAGNAPSGPVMAFQAPSAAIPFSLDAVRLQNPGIPVQQLPAPGSQMDKAMLLRPPAGSFAVQTPRDPLPQAKKLYPDLKLQPLQTAAAEHTPALTNASGNPHKQKK